jgi:hypothetical protein
MEILNLAGSGFLTPAVPRIRVSHFHHLILDVSVLLVVPYLLQSTFRERGRLHALGYQPRRLRPVGCESNDNAKYPFR